MFSADFAALTGAEQAELIDKTAYPNSEILAYMTALRRKHGLPEEPLSEQELAALAKEKGLDKTNVPAIQVVLDKVGKAGREIEFMLEGTTRKLGLSSSRTKVRWTV